MTFGKYAHRAQTQSNSFSNSKICILVHTFLKGGGGTASLRVFIHYLSTRPLRVYLVTGPDVNRDIIDEFKGVKWICLPTFRRPLNVVADFKTCLDLWRLFRSERFELLHTNYAKPGVIGRVLGRLSGVKIIVHHIYGCTFNDAYAPGIQITNRFLEVLLSKLTNYYIFVGRDILSRYRRTKIRLDNNFSVVYPAANFQPYIEVCEKRMAVRNKKHIELGLGKNNFAIGLVSRFISGKGHMQALEVIDDLRKTHPQIKAFFVGRGPLQNEILHQIDSKGLRDTVKILGYRNDLESLMVSWDVGIFTSFGEGLPQVLAQMVLVGLPVVTFAVDGAKELVKDGQTGFIVPIGDTKAMADRLRMLLDNIDDFQSRLWGKPNIISSDWNPGQMSKKLYKIYLKLLAGTQSFKR